MVSKPSLKQVHEKWMLEAPEIAKKQKNKKQKTKQRLAHLKICIELQKSHWGLGWLSFFGWMPKIRFCFQLPNRKKYCLGVEKAPAY